MSSSYLTFPVIDPVIVSIGPLALRWYGLMYLIGFVAAWWLAKKRADRAGWSDDQVSDMLFMGFLGVILGGRIGYVLFYNVEQFIQNPLYLFKIWEGGMSFHGGLLGVLVALFLFGRKNKIPFLTVGDFVAPLVPIGLGAGRLGNFINAELWGRTTDVPWAFVFPGAGPEPRHPSQLYEFALEGVVLFFMLWIFSAKPKPTGAIGGLFLLGYGAFRFFVEYFREPDAHIGLHAELISQGQILSMPMIIAGLGLMIYAYKFNQNAVSSPTKPNQNR